MSARDPLREVGATTLTEEYTVVFGKDLFDVDVVPTGDWKRMKMTEFHPSSAQMSYLSYESGLLNYRLTQKVVISSHHTSEGMCSFPNVSNEEMPSHRQNSS